MKDTIQGISSRSFSLQLQLNASLSPSILVSVPPNFANPYGVTPDSYDSSIEASLSIVAFAVNPYLFDDYATNNISSPVVQIQLR